MRATTSLVLVVVAACMALAGAMTSRGTSCFVNHGSFGVWPSQRGIELRRTSHARARQACTTMMSFPDLVGNFKKGDKVKVVAKDVIFFHVLPKEYPNGYAVPVGLEGVIANLANIEPKSGKEVSPNRPLLVKFDSPKFQAHFEARELEKC